MNRYTYTLNPGQGGPEKMQTYRRSQLEKMTTFQLREICRKEKLVVPFQDQSDRESLARLVMRFRGQKEYRHIDGACEDGFQRLEEFLRRSHVSFSYDEGIRIPATIVIYRGTGLGELDNYQIEGNRKPYEGNLLLVDELYKVYTCFYIKESNGRFYLIKGKEVPILPLEKHQYSILYFPDEKISEFLYDRYYNHAVPEPGHVEGIRIPLLNLEAREVMETDLPLVIDFGSSNTTMGICLPDGSARTARAGNGHVIPSVVGVAGLRESAPEFVFGYEALSLNDQNYRDEDVPVFYDIKRWVSSAERSEGVILKNGHKYLIPRKEMLQGFFEYLIDLAREQFKCSFKNIQLLAPIRQKEKFQNLFKELLPDYQVDCTLDEGMAVLFQSIHGLISRESYERGRWYHALIIDCGGGTTDLTSGRFRIDNNRVSYLVDLETSYENGDTNFGGNNLTYRILQMIKIRIAQALTGSPAGADRIGVGGVGQMDGGSPGRSGTGASVESGKGGNRRLGSGPEERLGEGMSGRYEGRPSAWSGGGVSHRYEEGPAEWLGEGPFSRYEGEPSAWSGWGAFGRSGWESAEWEDTDRTIDRLEEEYRAAERILPTRFRDYEERAREEYFYVKNNYYYLFEVAEQVKKMFFQREFRYEIWLSTRKEGEKPSVFLDKWRLSPVERGRFRHISQEVEFPLYLNQVEDLLRLDIYSMMERFLDQKFEQGELTEYEMIKLTGQSCKSRLFTEALKQYVPGKLIKSGKKEEGEAELKMCCLEGALAYFKSCKLGYMQLCQSYQVGSLPYEIMAYTHENKEKVLIRSLDREDHIGCISRFRVGRQLDLYLNDGQGRRLRTYYYEYDASRFGRTTQEEIDHKYGGTVIQEETDTILEGELKFFVWVTRKRWGFVVLPVLREGEVLYQGEETFFDFEDDTWELNFFDGRK